MIIFFSQLRSNDLNFFDVYPTINKIMLAKRGEPVEIGGKIFTKVGGFGPTFSLLQLNKSFSLSFMIYQIKIKHHRCLGSWTIDIDDKKLVLPLTKKQLNYTIADSLGCNGRSLILQGLMMYEINKHYATIGKKKAYSKIDSYINSIAKYQKRYNCIKDKQRLVGQVLDPEIIKKLHAHPELLQKKESRMHPLLATAKVEEQNKAGRNRKNKPLLRKNDANRLMVAKKQEGN
jgi:hypothetical protein